MPLLPPPAALLLRTLLAAISLAALPSPVPAMTVNLARPYTPVPSPPRQDGVGFYAPGNDTFLFDQKTTHPEIICLPFRRAFSLTWSLHHNMVNAPLFEGTALPRFDNSLPIPLPVEKLAPGFYDLRVKITLSRDATIDATTTFGWRIPDLPIHPEEPADFDAFWRAALDELAAIDPHPTWKKERTLTTPEIDAYNLTSAALPENYDPSGVLFGTVEVYRVHYPSYAGQTIEAWYAKPPGPGPFPTLLILPGAGNNPQPIPAEHARHGYAALIIQVHGNPVDAPKYQRPPPDEATTPRQRQHFPIYLHALQAARAIKLLPGADPTRLAVMGGSQGGRLSLVVAALDPSVRAAIPAIAHFAYRPWGHWTEHLNQTHSPGPATGFPGPSPTDLGNPADPYFDVLNFARRVHCPVLLNAGLTDAVSPPTGIYAIYQALPGPKQIIPLPNTGHDWSPAFDRLAWPWLHQHLTP